MRTIKQIDIKDRTYYFYNDIIHLESFKSNLLKTDKKSYKDIGIYNIGYITIKKIGDVKIFTALILCIYISSFINIYIQIYIPVLYETRMTQKKNYTINAILQHGRVADNNCCVVSPTSRFPYLILCPR